MYPFSQAVTPAVRNHLEAQTSFMNDVSKSLFRSFQQVCELNIQLAQTMLEETSHAGQQMLTSERQTDAIAAAASRAQPATDKLRAYQQHISRLAADAQVDITRVTEDHVQKTAQTARALADEVARAASEETERGMRKQEETMRQFSDPFSTSGSRGQDNQMGSRGNASSAGSATLQSGSSGSSQASASDSARQNTAASPQPAARPSSPSRPS
ncbi:phasin family protein [Massilia sp. S19_KUP03_FR1]|uniref:phasin family protein n=1 Tax=Massilia sp. S19_KUP03_FR1 TaxID=3025503 RepID=UPI002FCD8F41